VIKTKSASATEKETGLEEDPFAEMMKMIADPSPTKPPPKSNFLEKTCIQIQHFANERRSPKAKTKTKTKTKYPEVFCDKKRKKALLRRANGVKGGRLDAKWFFIPKCNKDGTFSSVQCTTLPLDNPHCWCARADGAWFPKTNFRKRGFGYLRPVCRRHRKTQLHLNACKGKRGPQKHPFDCHRFMNCGKNIAFSCACQKNLYFDAVDKLCTYPWLARCDVPSG